MKLVNGPAVVDSIAARLTLYKVRLLEAHMQEERRFAQRQNAFKV